MTSLLLYIDRHESYSSTFFLVVVVAIVAVVFVAVIVIFLNILNCILVIYPLLFGPATIGFACLRPSFAVNAAKFEGR